jgi:DNA-binding CsgD family transcriptional regulator
MAHFAFAIYFLAAASSLVAAGAFLFIYRSGRSPLIKSYLVFLGISLAQTLLTLAGLYASATSLLDVAFAGRLYYFAGTIVTGAQAYAFPRFFLEFADLPFSRTPKRVSIAACSIAVASSPLVFLPEAQFPLNFLPPSLGLVAFLSLMLYSQVKLIGAYPRIRDKVGRIGVPAIVAYDLVCIAAGVTDSLLSGGQLASGRWPYGALLQPSIAVAWNLLSLAWAFAYEGSGTLARPASVEPDPARAKAAGLTERELELARLLASGAANKEMAASLGLSPNTVRNHVHNIYEKTGARNRVELVRALCGADDEGAASADY